MDVTSFIRQGIFIFLLTGIVGCGDMQYGSETFPEAYGDCYTSADKSKFIVKWKSGSITQETGQNRQQFIRDFVEPKLQEIERVEYDQRISVHHTQAHARKVELSTTADNWGANDINASAAWSRGIRGEGVIVAVVDSGVDAAHPQLAEQIAYNFGESGFDSRGRNKATNGIDDDGNGLVDDYAGYQFALRNAQPADASGHGTHVAGIIAAAHNDSQVKAGRVQGIAPGSKILPSGFLGPNATGRVSDALAAIDYAVARGARVINASWGGSLCSQVLKDRINRLASENVAFVTSAGNNGADIDRSHEYPASYNLPMQITVGATNYFNLVAIFSNYGDQRTHLFAPGDEIISTYPGGLMAVMSGTSMAAPFVSGALALMISYKPQASIAELREALLNSTEYSPSYRSVSRGRLNVASALQSIEHL